MNRLDLIKKLLPGILPLFVYLLADAIWETQTALIIAVVFGLAEFGYTLVAHKKADKFILLDTAFLVVMGGISWLLHDDIFFKLKPALVELILCAFLGISAFTPNNLLLKMTGRYLDNMVLNPFVIRRMQRSTLILFWLVTVHTVLIVISAFLFSKAAWAFISGGLFYIIFALYFGFEYLNNKRLAKDEWLPLVDEDGHITGKAPRSECHKGPGMLHPVVHLHVFNSKGELYLQKRREDKLVQPGKWDTAVGGHISFGNTIEEGLMREAKEELGIEGFQPVLLRKYKWETPVESELVFMFRCIYDREITIDPGELSDGRFWKLSEIQNKLGQGVFTPNFELEFDQLDEV